MCHHAVCTIKQCAIERGLFYVALVATHIVLCTKHVQLEIHALHSVELMYKSVALMSTS